MNVDILLFATLREIAGSSQVQLDLPRESTTVDEVRAALAERYPDMDENVKVAIASVNQEFAFGDDPVKDGDELAFFPPVSGGADQPEIFRLPQDPINHDEIIEAITTPMTGAVCLFSGIVREKTSKTGHLPVTKYLEYEAYEPMALAKMQQVAAEIREQWPKVQGIAILQRIGKLSGGHNTVLIACSAAHRDDGAFEASRFGIDRLKEIVPVWKKEIRSDGTTWIEGEYTPTADDIEEIE